jgi:hypothetical protein
MGPVKVSSTNMSEPGNPWIALAADSLDLAIESQDVIGLRLARAASGRFDACDEAVRMVVEKAFAAWDTAVVVTESMIQGEPHLAASRTLALYRRRVQANQRRLAREARS